MPIEIGYGDLTVGQFEKETGIRLAVEREASDRFARRYALLTTKHRDRWLAWRALKLRQSLDRMSKRLRAGPHPWRLCVYPTFKHQQIDQMPWLADPVANPKRCLAGMETFLRDSGFPVDQYHGDVIERRARSSRARLTGARRSSKTALNNRSRQVAAGNDIGLVAPLVTVGFKARTATEHLLDHYVWNNNPGTLAAVDRIGSFFINTALDEVDCPATAAEAWPWKGTSRGVFVARGAGDNAMTDFVNVLAHATGRMIITQWMDCNMETGAGAQLRRFAREFYATPEAVFTSVPVSRVRGVIAQTAPRDKGGIFLRLVNSSPYRSDGVILASSATVQDLVYDTVLPSTGNGTHRVTLMPNDIRTFAISSIRPEEIRCRFELDRTIATKIFRRAHSLLEKPAIRNRLPRDKMRQLRAALDAKDAFAVYRVLVDYEVFGIVGAE